MTFYKLFFELLSNHGMAIFDFPERCKAEFKKRGFDESALEARLFFLLLDKNIVREIINTANVYCGFPPHSLALMVFAKMFGSEKLPNEYESILIRHIDSLVEIMENNNIVQLECFVPTPTERASDLTMGAGDVVRRYGMAMLESPQKMKSALHDVCDGFLEKEIEQFCAFLERLNKGETLFREAEGLAFLKMLDEVLNAQNLSYPPLAKQSAAFAAQNGFSGMIKRHFEFVDKARSVQSNADARRKRKKASQA